VGLPPHLRGIGHCVERGPPLVLERLERSQQVERAVRGASGEAALGDRPIGRGVDRDVGRVGRGPGVGGVEESFSEAVRRARPGEPGVEQDRPIGDRLVELGEGRHPVLGPLVGVEAAHRGDPRTGWGIGSPPGQRVLDLCDRGRVLEDRVVAGPVGQAHDVDVWLGQAGHHGSSLEVDDANAGSAGRRAVTDCDEPPIADRRRAGHGARAVHRVDPSVGEYELRGRVVRRCARNEHSPALGRRRGTRRAGGHAAEGGCEPGGCARFEHCPSRDPGAVLGLVGHALAPLPARRACRVARRSVQPFSPLGHRRGRRCRRPPSARIGSASGPRPAP
jgi:hypothetical protein